MLPRPLKQKPSRLSRCSLLGRLATSGTMSVLKRLSSVLIQTTKTFQTVVTTFLPRKVLPPHPLLLNPFNPYPLRPLKGALPPPISIGFGRSTPTRSASETPRRLSPRRSSGPMSKPCSPASGAMPPRPTTGRGAIRPRGSTRTDGAICRHRCPEGRRTENDRFWT